MTYTAITVKKFRQKAGSLAEKICSELALIAARINLSGDITVSDAGVATIGAAKVTKAKAKVFVSTEQTADGSAQSIAHGLAATPAFVLVTVTNNAGIDTQWDVAEGSHTSTNVVVTVTTGVTYKVLAWA